MFAKVFSQILDSSLAEDYRVRLVFEDLLKLADKDGVVDITRESIARRTNVPLKIVTDGLRKLEEPDTTSRTPDLDGRRIVRLDEHRDWGWRIVNFAKYRESATREMLRMAEKERKKEWRRRKGFPSHSLSQVQSTEAEAEAEQSQVRPKVSGTNMGQTARRPFPDSSEEALKQCSLDSLPPEFVEDTWNKAESRGGKDSKGNDILSFPAYCRTEWKYEAQRRHLAKSQPPTTTLEDKEIARLRRQVDRL